MAMIIFYTQKFWLVKKSTLIGFFGEVGIIVSASSVSLHLKMYKNWVKWVIFKVSYLSIQNGENHSRQKLYVIGVYMQWFLIKIYMLYHILQNKRPGVCFVSLIKTSNSHNNEYYSYRLTSFLEVVPPGNWLTGWSCPPIGSMIPLRL